MQTKRPVLVVHGTSAPVDDLALERTTAEFARVDIGHQPAAGLHAQLDHGSRPPDGDVTD